MEWINLALNYYELRKNLSKTKTQITQMQNTSLLKLLHHAYDNSPYYRRTFQQAGIHKEDINNTPLHAFPSIDKEILMEHFDDIVSVDDVHQDELRKFDTQNHQNELFQGKYHVVHSSGSTGKPGYFIYDKDAWQTMLCGILRGALWDMKGLEIVKLLGSVPRIAYIAATDGRYGGAMAVNAGIQGIHGKQVSIDIKTPLHEWIQVIEEFQPNIIIGYPSAIKILGELVHKGSVRVDVKRMITCGEPLSLSLRHYLEKAFHCVVVNIYGASESLALGVETKEEEGMILFDDLNVIEVEHEHIYLTSLYNYAQPLIRYKISDRLTLRKEREEFRFPFSRVEHVAGRNEDILWFEDETHKREFLHPLAIEGFCVEGLLDYQFQKVNDHAFTMIAQASSPFLQAHIETEIKKQMRQILKEKNLHYVTFMIEFVDEILPHAKTGKKQLIIT